MYRINYSENSLNSIKLFIDAYKKSFISLFYDSGLVWEETIINGYIKIGDGFNDLIFSKIDNKFITEKILWESETTTWLFMITISVNNFKLFIYYKEDIELKERYIENIEFYKK